jgi:LuxR family maltose regulon positive regulatory protein
VRRPHLWSRLATGTGSALTTVVGPPGAGKSTVVADWLDRSGQAPGHVAWLVLEPGDRAADAFWAAVLDAVRASGAVPDGAALGALRPAPMVDEAFVDALVEGFAELPAPVLVVLDDVHVLGPDTPPAGLDEVLALADGLRVVAVGREAPPVARHRLLLAGRLVEIGPTDLALGGTEVGELFSGAGLALDAAGLDAVMARTHGWAAAVRVAAMRWHEEGAAGLAGLGHDGPIADYLAAELLDGLAPDVRAFLERTAPVAALAPELAAVLDTGRAAPDHPAVDLARRRLERLAARHALVVRMGPGRSDPAGSAGPWFACHPLLRDLLLTRLAHDPARAALSHRLAAVWLEAHDRPIEALGHATASGDWDLVADVAMRSAAARFVGEERTALLDALAAIPRARARGDAALTTALAAQAYCRYDVDDLVRQIAAADEALETDAAVPPGSVRRGTTIVVLRVVEAGLAVLTGDAERMLGAAREAAVEVAALPPAAVPGWSVYEDVAEVNTGLAELWTGSFEAGVRRLATRESVGAGTATFGLHAAGLRALGLVLAGRPAEAGEVGEGALARARDRGWDHMVMTAGAWAAVALSALERGDLVIAEASIEAVRRLTPRLAGDWLVQTAIDLADVGHLLLGHGPQEAAEALAVVDRRVASGRSTGILPAWTDYVGAQVELAAGDADAVLARLDVWRRLDGARPGRAARATGLPLGDRLDGLAVRALVVRGRVGEAADVLADAPRPLDLDPVTRIEIALARAVLARASGDHDAAHAALGAALRGAGERSAPRPFLVPDPSVAVLLDEHVRRGAEAPGASPDGLALARRLRHDGAGVSAEVAAARPGGDLLTDRERDVLEYLPSLLTVPQIAGQLHVTAHTVRHHLKGIYRKFDAVNRREAVAAAVARGLLTAPTALTRQVPSG